WRATTGEPHVTHSVILRRARFMSKEPITADDGTYPYNGVPLTPAIAQFLIRKLFAGKLVERQILVEEVLRAHLAVGGLKPSAQKTTDTIKKALGDMKESGVA